MEQPSQEAKMAAAQAALEELGVDKRVAAIFSERAVAVFWSQMALMAAQQPTQPSQPSQPEQPMLVFMAPMTAITDPALQEQAKVLGEQALKVTQGAICEVPKPPAA